MSYFKGKQGAKYRDLLYKALIFIGTVAVIVYFLPRDGKFNYQFDIDKPWKYGQLMATFDFPIYKDEDVVKREQDSIFANFQPYYLLDKAVESNALNRLKSDYQSRLKNILPTADYLRYIEKKLSEIYEAGILSVENWGDALLCPMVDARRMEVYTAFFDRDNHTILDTKAEIITADSFADLLAAQKVYFFGNGSEKVKSILASPNACFIDQVETSARHLVPLSEELYQQEQFVDTAYFEPFYLKDFIATVPKKKII